ncbi:MAG TPA: hypothetical protein VE076_08100 [Nitrososphaeraceae archaeon]|nr:hypothetical protein [Nitrososphaeraceae archaeon]
MIITFLVDNSGANKEAFLVKAEPFNPSERICSAKPNYGNGDHCHINTTQMIKKEVCHIHVSRELIQKNPV